MKKFSPIRHGLPFALLCVLVLSTGCQKAYYNTMEQFGYHKRDLMASRVKKARDAQEETKEQFETALERFRSVLAFDGGKLQEKYDQLNAEFKISEQKARLVRKRIDDVEDVAAALFAEWEEELDQYKNQSLRSASQAKLRRTKGQYTQLIGAMKRAEKKIDPVLSAFRDQVLFLKHNLNAQAIASLKSELRNVESDVAVLIRDMERSIREADAFITEMEQR